MQLNPKAGESGWIPFPSKVCNFFKRGTCLRFECQYFHGTETQLSALHVAGAELYRVNDGRIHYKKNSDMVEEGEEGMSPTELIVHPTPALTVSPSDASPTTVLNEEDGSPKSEVANVQHLETMKPISGHQRRKIVACLNHLAGKCTHSACRFVHLKPEIRLLPPGVCAFHPTEHGCVKGAECRYFHGTKEELEKMRDSGIVAYNPFTNKPYEELPGELEEQQRVKPATTTTATTPHYVSSHQTQPPTVQQSNQSPLLQQNYVHVQQDQQQQQQQQQQDIPHPQHYHHHQQQFPVYVPQQQQPRPVIGNLVGYPSAATVFGPSVPSTHSQPMPTSSYQHQQQQSVVIGHMNISSMQQQVLGAQSVPLFVPTPAHSSSSPQFITVPPTTTTNTHGATTAASLGIPLHSPIPPPAPQLPMTMTFPAMAFPQQPYHQPTGLPSILNNTLKYQPHP